LWYAFCMGHLQALEMQAGIPIMIEILDPDGLDDETLAALSTPKVNKVELIVVWIERILTKAMRDKVLDLHPPILTRGFMDWTAAMKSFHGCLKITQTPYPHPQLQVVLGFLVIHWALTPFVMLHWTKSIVYSALFTFCQVFILWALFDTARMLEDPFGNDPTDLHLETANTRMNESLLLLVEGAMSAQPRAQSHARQGCTENWENGTLLSRVPTTSLEVSPEPHKSLWLRRRFGYSGQSNTMVRISGGLQQRNVDDSGSFLVDKEGEEGGAAQLPFVQEVRLLVSAGRSGKEPRAQEVGRSALSNNDERGMRPAQSL